MYFDKLSLPAKFIISSCIVSIHVLLLLFFGKNIQQSHDLLKAKCTLMQPLAKQIFKTGTAFAILQVIKNNELEKYNEKISTCRTRHGGFSWL